MSKIWKNNGTEDKFIEKLIKTGKVTKHTKPLYLQEEYPQYFNGFTIDVIRNHLNILKQKNGLFLIDDPINENIVVMEEKEKSEPLKSASINTTPQHEIYPCVVETFKDPDTLLDKVVVTIDLPGGSENVKVNVNEEGTKAFINYDWPKIMYNVEELYQPTEPGELYHPKILAIKKGLMKIRMSVDAIPQGSTTISLPIRVQTIPSSMEITGIARQEGSLVVEVVFTGIESQYFKKVADGVVNFRR